MARKVKDLAVKIGSYTNSNGEEKGRYMGCGSLMEGDDGNQFIMLNRFINYTALPRKQGSDGILISVFDLREREGANGNQRAAMVDDDGLDGDSIPF
jgi:hypothetical protein